MRTTASLQQYLYYRVNLSNPELSLHSFVFWITVDILCDESVKLSVFEFKLYKVLFDQWWSDAFRSM